MRKSTVDLLVIIGIIIVAVPIVVTFHVRPLISTIYFFILPSIYLLIRKPRDLNRILSGSLLIGIVLGFILDFLATFNKAWYVPQNQLVIPYRMFGIVPIDDMVWFFFWAFLIILCYEHFLEDDKTRHISKNLKWGILPSVLIAFGILALYATAPGMLEFHYAYLTLGLLAIIPLIWLAIRKPKMVIRFLKICPLFIFLFLVFELCAIYLQQWSFPGEYIGYIKFFSIKFPLEEFFFWILVSSTVVLSDYELFVDDIK